MARQLNRLAAKAVEALAKARKVGRHADGGGLYLSITANGGCSWLFLFRAAGKQREAGLGPYPRVTLAEARDKAEAYRKLLAAGVDPIEAKRTAPETVPTFGKVADDLLGTLSRSFRNSKHAAQWKRSLEVEAAALRPIPVDRIGTDDVLAVLGPLWHETPESASRLRGRLERVLDAAEARGLRSGKNPAAWKGTLATLLGKHPRGLRGHHKAMPIDELPPFMRRLRVMDGATPRALELAIRTAARPGEVIGMTWAEVDGDAALWTVPANRMKAGRIHRVPLTPRALAILEEMRLRAGGEPSPDALVFPGRKPGAKLSEMALAMVLRRLKITNATPHGFRSTFRDWAGDRSPFPREIAEAALSHAVGDKTELAYRRGDALAKRRELMLAWESFCDRISENVVSFRSA